MEFEEFENQVLLDIMDFIQARLIEKLIEANQDFRHINNIPEHFTKVSSLFKVAEEKKTTWAAECMNMFMNKPRFKEEWLHYCNEYFRLIPESEYGRIVQRLYDTDEIDMLEEENILNQLLAHPVYKKINPLVWVQVLQKVPFVEKGKYFNGDIESFVEKYAPDIV